MGIEKLFGREPEKPGKKSGTAYEQWKLYWMKRFEKEYKLEKFTVDYWGEMRRYIEQKWNGQ